MNTNGSENVEATRSVASEPSGAPVRSTDWFDDDEYSSLYYDPENDCPRCHGAGKCALLSGIEWDYTGPDYDICPRCQGSGRL